MGLNATLFTAGRSLEMFAAGIQVAGNNVANANTPNYVREDLKVSTSAPYESNGLLFGTGAQTNGIRQEIDLYLESQIHLANADVKSADARVSGYSQLQLIVGELGTNDLSSQLNEFLGTLNEVVNQPELATNRQLVVQEGERLADAIGTMRNQLDRSRQAVNSGIDSIVEEANLLITEIARLNTQIVKAESAGLLKSDAGGLRSSRLTALNRLSEIVPIRTEHRANGIVDVFSGNDFLVIQGTTNPLETLRESDRGIPVDQIQLEKTKSPLNSQSGELIGAIEARDSVLGGFVDQLDRYTSALIQGMNRLHSSGEGLTGYSEVTASNDIGDTAAALNQAGLAFTPEHGSFEIKLFNQTTQTTATTLVNIDLDGLGGNDTSLNDLQAALDAIGNLQASINTDGQLQLTAADGFDIRFGNDSSGVLASLGINTFFQGSDANNIQVNDYLRRDPGLFAAGQGGGPGDNTNAVLLAQFTQTPQESLGGISLDEFYEHVTGQIAEGAAAESAIADGFRGFQTSLQGQRQQISGVSLDEEAVRILELQHGYTAAARIISTIEELFNTLVNL